MALLSTSSAIVYHCSITTGRTRIGTVLLLGAERLMSGGLDYFLEIVLLPKLKEVIVNLLSHFDTHLFKDIED